jgi:hypothetical protein
LGRVAMARCQNVLSINTVQNFQLYYYSED